MAWFVIKLEASVSCYRELARLVVFMDLPERSRGVRLGRARQLVGAFVKADVSQRLLEAVRSGSFF